MKIPVYPQEFFHFDRNSATDEEINKWIQECIDQLEEHKSMQSSMIASGGSRIEIHRLALDENSDEYYYDIVVTHNYLHKDTISSEQLNRVFK